MRIHLLMTLSWCTLITTMTKRIQDALNVPEGLICVKLNIALYYFHVTSFTPDSHFLLLDLIRFPAAPHGFLHHFLNQPQMAERTINNNSHCSQYLLLIGELCLSLPAITRL